MVENKDGVEQAMGFCLIRLFRSFAFNMQSNLFPEKLLKWINNNKYFVSLKSSIVRRRLLLFGTCLTHHTILFECYWMKMVIQFWWYVLPSALEYVFIVWFDCFAVIVVLP